MEMHSYALRVPKDVWEELKAAAKLNRRSVNQESVWRLSERGSGSDARSASDAWGPDLSTMPRSESSPVYEVAEERTRSDGSLVRPGEVGYDFATQHVRPFKPDFGSRLKGDGA
jgi:hypothetical protein